MHLQWLCLPYSIVSLMYGVNHSVFCFTLPVKIISLISDFLIACNDIFPLISPICVLIYFLKNCISFFVTHFKNLILTAVSDDVATPSIHAPNHAIIGRSLVLNCSVPFEQGTAIDLQWSVPDQSGRDVRALRTLLLYTESIEC